MNHIRSCDVPGKSEYNPGHLNGSRNHPEAILKYSINLPISQASCGLEKARKHVFLATLQYLKVNVMVTQASSLSLQKRNCMATAR